MTTLPVADEIRRLAFARFVFQRGLDQMRLPDPTCSAALLAFDDASELVLHLAALRLGAKANERISFMEHFAAIDGKLPQGQRTPLKVQMEVLHDARNALKHRGRFPSRVQLEDYRGSCERFLGELTEMVFGVAFFRLSLADFVEPQEARECLREAEQAILAGDHGGALEKAALAFEEIVHTHRRKRFRFGRSAYESGDDVSRVHLPLRLESDRLTQNVDDALKALLGSVREIQRAMLMAALGVDLRGFMDFRAVAPGVTRLPTGKCEVWWHPAAPGKAAASAEDAQRCVAFVVESALKLQER